MKLQDLTSYLDDLLQLKNFSGDYSNNGLQVEGTHDVRRAVFAVDASMQLFEEAVKRQADVIFVHHGISWGDQPRRFTGTDGSRLRILFQNNISLYAAHLPLDAHPEVGNNAVLCRIAGLKEWFPCCEYAGAEIGFSGLLPEPLSPAEVARIYENALNCKAALFDFSAGRVKKTAVVSGGGGRDALFAAVQTNSDILITGEMDHTMYHTARELGISVIALGHYASETTGPRAVMAAAAAKFPLECEFIDLPTGL